MAKSKFYETILNEILATSFATQEERFSYLSALGKVTGSLEYSEGRLNFVFSVSSSDIALNIVNMLKIDYPTEFEMLLPKTKTNKGSGSKFCTVSVPKAYTQQVLVDLGLLILKDGVPAIITDSVPTIAVKDQKNAKAYLMGLFVASGSIFVPSLESSDEKKDGYHFEISVNSEDYADTIITLIGMFGINAKKSERSQNFLIYLKDKDEILAMLGVMGIVEGVAQLKSIINERQTANIINRTSICEAANMDKTFVASSKQLVAIGIIEETVGLETLTPELYETAQARMSAQTASLSELAEMLGVSKSCLNHRLRKIMEIASGMGNIEG